MTAKRTQNRHVLLEQLCKTSPGITAHLLEHNTPPDPPPEGIPDAFPLPDEPHLKRWETYQEQAREKSLLHVLQQHFAQFTFPIREGISQDPDYRAATLKGQEQGDTKPGDIPIFEAPDQLHLNIAESPAGRLPVLSTPSRKDFGSLVRILGMRNEPNPIPPTMGASMISGLINWDRIRQHKANWLKNNDPTAWGAEFKHFTSNKTNFQDRIMILSHGPYSGTPASSLNLDETAWLETSFSIRLHHECAHYLTKRVYGVMRTHIMDEITADFAGIVTATGVFHADWLKRFLGIENPAGYRNGGRLENYLGDLPREALEPLSQLARLAVDRLDQLTDRFGIPTDPASMGRFLCRLYRLSIEELAGPEAERLFMEAG